MKRVPWKYLAGLIDGEGCIDVQVTKSVYIRPRVRIGLTKSSRFLLERIQNSFGGAICDRKGSGTWQDSSSWELAGYSSCQVLRNIVNHLILKKEQARLCLWMETAVKGQHVSTEVRDAIRGELALMKRDPHRLSENAQHKLAGMLQSEPSQ